MPTNGLTNAQNWLNITEHIQGGMLGPFRPPESATGVARSAQEWQILTNKCHIPQYIAPDGPNGLNRAENG